MQFQTLLLASMSVFFVIFPDANAQQFPVKSIRLVVPAPPGAGMDTLARMVADKAAQGLGQPIVIENNGSADGMVAATLVARSTADGYVLLVGNAATHTAHLYRRNPPYDPVRDFAPITGGGLSVTCLAVPASLGVQSIAELINLIRRNPGKHSFGTGGTTVNNGMFVSGDAFKRLTGTDLVGVPFAAIAPLMTELLAGRVSMAFTTVTSALPQDRAGKVKILAITESRRYAMLPDVPTLAEVLPGFASTALWNGYFARAGTPQGVVQRLNVEMVKGLKSADESKLPGITLIGGTPDEFANFVKIQTEDLAKLLKATGFQPE